MKNTATPASTWAAFSRVRTQPRWRFTSQPPSSWLSIAAPRKRLASRYHLAEGKRPDDLIDAATPQGPGRSPPGEPGGTRTGELLVASRDRGGLGRVRGSPWWSIRPEVSHGERFDRAAETPGCELSPCFPLRPSFALLVDLCIQSNLDTKRPRR